jgi:hypothetical protein
MGRLPPPPAGTRRPSFGAERPPLSPADEAARRRARWWLLLVPFTFPVYARVRREHPEAAARLRLELGVCVFNSVLFLLLGCCACSFAAFRVQLIDVLSRWLISTGLVR